MQMLKLPASHAAVTTAFSTFDNSHLDGFTISLTGKGRDPGTDIIIEIAFSCHVYSERADSSDSSDFRDHFGNGRRFCNKRHSDSIMLPALMRQTIQDDLVCNIAKDHNQTANLAYFDLGRGDPYWVIFYLEPASVRPDVIRLNVISAYRAAQGRRSGGNKFSYFARQCVFKQKRVP